MWIGFCFISIHSRFVFVLFYFLVFSVFLIHCLHGGSKRLFSSFFDTHVVSCFMCICECVVWARAFNFKPIIIMILSTVKMIYTHHSPAWNVYSKCFRLFNDLNNFKFMQKYQQQQQQPTSSVYVCFRCPNRCHFFVILLLIFVVVWYFISRLLYLLLRCRL